MAELLGKDMAPARKSNFAHKGGYQLVANDQAFRQFAGLNLVIL